MFIMNGIFNSLFENVVVAHLPFHPPAFLRGLTHRGILGDDYDECGTTFLFVLSSLSIRPTVKRILNFGIELPGLDTIQGPNRFRF